MNVKQREQIIEKIKKVLALAENNPSENEAIAAALKAQKMMAEYHIDEKELFEEIKEEEILGVRAEVGGRNQKWRIILGLVLAKNFRCKCLGDYDKTLVFFGYREDAEICSQVYQTMYKIGVRLSDKLKRQERERWGTAKGVRNTFCMGFVDGIRSELEKQCTALMIVTPKEVTDKFNMYVNSGKTKSSKFKIGNVMSDERIYNEGYRSGKDAIRARAIEGSC